MERIASSRCGLRFGLLLAIWCVTGGLLLNVVWATVFALPQKLSPLSAGGAAVAARTPYTVRLQESTRDASGDVKPQGTVTYALGGDSSFVVLYEYLVPPVVVIQRTIELPTGVTVVVDDVRERRSSTFSRGGPSMRARMDPTNNCTKNDRGEPVFRGDVLGPGGLVADYDTVRVRAGDLTLWLARQLGCAQVKSSAQLPMGVVNEKVAIAIAPGEPDAALFQVPDRYEEVPPSVFRQMDPDAPESQQMDRAYYGRRPPG